MIRACSPSPRIIICVPSGFDQVERRAIRESAIGAGASQGSLIEEPMAAAIGATCRSPSRPARWSSISAAAPPRSASSRWAAWSMPVRCASAALSLDEAIINYISRNYGMLIGENTAEASRRTSARLSGRRGARWKSGINKAEAFRANSISSERILGGTDRTAQQHRLGGQVGAGKTPPELGADIADKGMVLTGGGALLRDLDRLLMEETGLPVIVAEEPLTCVARVVAAWRSNTWTNSAASSPRIDRGAKARGGDNAQPSYG